MGVRERRAREKAARRRALLDAARALVVEKGLSATTRQIAAACELSEATLFNYFKSKDEILVSLLFEAMGHMSQGLDAIATSEGAPREKVERLWSFFAGVRDEHPEYFHLFGHLSQPRATAAVSDEVRAEIVRRSGHNLRQLAAILAEVVGEDRARGAADLVWGALMGLMVLRDSRENLGAPAHPNDADLQRAVGLLLDGLLAAGDPP